MRQPLTRPWVIVALVALILGGAAAAIALGLNANVVAAIASAAAALAALISAVQSGEVARESTRALAWATKPVLYLQVFRNADKGGESLNISNASSRPIRRCVVTWRTKDGERGSEDLGGLGGGEYVIGFGGGVHQGAAYEQLQLGKWADSEGETKIAVDYWGTSSPVGWRTTATFTWRAEQNNFNDPSAGVSYLATRTSVTDTELL